MILRKVMGQRRHTTPNAVLRKMGRLTALIHSISTSGSGIALIGQAISYPGAILGRGTCTES